MLGNLMSFQNIYYGETVNSFEAMRNIPTRGSKVRCILNNFWRDLDCNIVDRDINLLYMLYFLSFLRYFFLSNKLHILLVIRQI